MIVTPTNKMVWLILTNYHCISDHVPKHYKKILCSRHMKLKFDLLSISFNFYYTGLFWTVTSIRRDHRYCFTSRCIFCMNSIQKQWIFDLIRFLVVLLSLLSRFYFCTNRAGTSVVLCSAVIMLRREVPQ